MSRRSRWCLLPFAVLLGTAGGSSEAATLVVANKSEATVSLVDLAAAKVAATLPTGDGPHEVAISPDGRLALVTNYGTGPAPGSSLTLIDIPAARVVKTIELGEYRRPHGVAWLPDGHRVLVTAEADRALLEVDVEAGEVVRAIPTDQEVSHMVAVTPDASRAFVANIGSGSVTAVDLAAGERLANIPTGQGAEGIAVSPDGSEVWITNRADDTVTVLDARSLETLATLESGRFPIRAAMTPDGRWVLVTNARSGDLAVFDRVARQLARRLPFELPAAARGGRLFGEGFGGSSVPIGVVVDPNGKRAFVAHSNADRVTVVDLESWQVVEALEAGEEPDGMGFSPAVAGGGSAPSGGGGR